MAFPLIAAAIGLAQFAPAIAKWLGGDQAQTIATQVVEAAKKVTNVDDPISAVRILSEDAALTAAFQKEILKMEAEFELQFLTDRNHARQRDIAITQSGRHNIRADIMVFSVALGLIACLYVLGAYAGTLPGEAVGIISMVAGIFGSCLKDAYTFEFGSSRCSREKDSIITRITQNNRF